MDVLMDFLMMSAQAIFGVFGTYCLLRTLSQVRQAGQSSSLNEAWAYWYTQLMWGVGALLLLQLCVWSSGMGFSMHMFVFIVVFALALLGLMQVSLVTRRAKQLAAAGVTGADDGAEVDLLQQVIVKKLVPNRVRGVDDDGQEVVFTEEDLRGLENLRGVVHMVRASGLGMALSNGAHIGPVMGFTNNQGDSFLLYADDVVVPAQMA